MIVRSTCGIILKISEHGESDKLVTLYSKDIGRVTGIAKGAKKSKRRFVNKLEEFSRLRFFYSPPRGFSGLLLISEAELLCANLSLRKDYRRYISATYISELTLRFTRDNDPDLQIYALLKWAFSSLEGNEEPQKIAVLFHLQLLAAVGYRPELNRCGQCLQPVASDRTFIFLPGTGSLLCNSCYGRQRSKHNVLSIQALKFLAHAQDAGIERLNRLQLHGKPATEALESLYHYTLHLLQQDIHSWQAMRRLNAPPSCEGKH